MTELQFRTNEEFSRLDGLLARWVERVPDAGRRRGILLRLVEAEIVPLGIACSQEEAGILQDPGLSVWRTAVGILEHSATCGVPMSLELAGQVAREMGCEIRKGPASEEIVPGVKGEDASCLLPFLTNTFDWFGTETVRALHPVQRATLLAMRLADLLPFERSNGPLTLILPWFYLMEGGFPPPVLEPGCRKEWIQALEQSLVMNSLPLADLIRCGVERSLTKLLES